MFSLNQRSQNQRSQKKFGSRCQVKLKKTVTGLDSMVMLAGLFLFLWFYVQPASAEPKRNIVLQWDKLMGGKDEDRGICAQSAVDGGYIIAGDTQSSYMWGHGGFDIYLAKLDAAGRMKWRKTIGNTKDNKVTSVKQTAEGGYIICGTTEAPFARKDLDVYLVKTDAAGIIQWQKTYGGTGEDTGTSVQQTEDGGYIITGTTNSSGAGDTDVYLGLAERKKIQ